jgi:hypothetical protein
LTAAKSGELSTEAFLPPATANDARCTDNIWCSIEMPKSSVFRFNTAPSDPIRWRKAQIQASSGEQVLLNKINTLTSTLGMGLLI